MTLVPYSDDDEVIFYSFVIVGDGLESLLLTKAMCIINYVYMEIQTYIVRVCVKMYRLLSRVQRRVLVSVTGCCRSLWILLSTASSYVLSICVLITCYTCGFIGPLLGAFLCLL